MKLEDVTGDDESSHVDFSLQMEKISTIREVSASLGVSLVINARTDIFLMPIGPEATRFERTLERLRAYRKAGADCLFAPGVRDRETIARLVKALDGPLNILVSPGCPLIPELEKIGVARASVGSALTRAMLGLVRRIGKELMESGSYTSLFEGTIPFADVQQMMRRQLS